MRVFALLSTALVAAFLLYQELFTHPAGTGFGDYQFFHHNWEFGRIAISRYGELPLWNPYYCGGIPDFGDPQTQVHHPLFFLSFLVGTTLALKIFVLAHAAAGLSGMYVYARRAENLRPAAAALAAGIWAGSGFFAWHCGTGHGGFVAFYLVPWLLFSWRIAATDLRFSIAVAGLLTLSLLAGGAYVFPYALLLIGFDAIVRFRNVSERRGIVIAGATSGILTLLLGAWRLIPILAHLHYYGRRRDTPDHLRLSELVDSLTLDAGHTDIQRSTPGHPYTWVEYGAFVGWGALVLAIAGAILAFKYRSRRSLVVGAVLFGSLALGSFARVSPWNVLRQVPIYASLQAPSRFLFALTFFLALLAAVALDRALERLTNARFRIVISAAALVALLLPIALHHRHVLADKWNGVAVPRGSSEPTFFLSFLSGSRDTAAYPPGAVLPSANHGTGHCYTGMDYRAGIGLWAGPTPQVRVSEPGRLESWGRTTRTIWADVDMPVSGHVVFNQTLAPGWRSDFGPPISDQKLAALDLPPGRRRVTLRYEPSSLPWAAACSLFGLAAAIALGFRRVASFVSSTPRHSSISLIAVAALGIVAYQRGVFAKEPEPNRPPIAKLRGASASDRAEREVNELFIAERAIDGKFATEWLGPDGQDAWLDVRLEPPTRVKTVAVLNAKNAPHLDRGTRRFRVEAYAGLRIVASNQAVFRAAPADEPNWVYVPLDVDSADRIRIVVESWYGLGGGIAELRIE